MILRSVRWSPVSWPRLACIASACFFLSEFGITKIFSVESIETMSITEHRYPKSSAADTIVFDKKGDIGNIFIISPYFVIIPFLSIAPKIKDIFKRQFQPLEKLGDTRHVKVY